MDSGNQEEINLINLRLELISHSQAVLHSKCLCE